MEIPVLNSRQLLALHAQITHELRERGITRSSNNPTGDLAEYLFCKAFGWQRMGKATAYVDAEGPGGTRYQIKGRRMTPPSHSRELGILRELPGGHFDFLAGVLFAEDYSVFRAAIIPRAVVVEHAKFVEWTNGYKFLLLDNIWEANGVRDATAELRAVSLEP
jgi:hypothetical protein